MLINFTVFVFENNCAANLLNFQFCYNNLFPILAISEVLTAVLPKLQAVWDVTSCSWARIAKLQAVWDVTSCSWARIAKLQAVWDVTSCSWARIQTFRKFVVSSNVGNHLNRHGVIFQKT